MTAPMVASGDDLKARLLNPRLDEGTVEIPGVGTIRMRGLSRGEVFAARKTTSGDQAAFEVRMLALALLDPVMTEDEIRQWQAASPAGEMEPIAEKVQILSGLLKEAEREAYADFRDEPGAGVRALPGSEVVDDGGAAAGADEQ